jgi:hypothetical protein
MLTFNQINTITKPYQLSWEELRCLEPGTKLIVWWKAVNYRDLDTWGFKSKRGAFLSITEFVFSSVTIGTKGGYNDHIFKHQLEINLFFITRDLTD